MSKDTKGVTYHLYIRSNLRVAQNGTFLTKPVYLEGGTMVPTRGKISDFKLSESPKKKKSSGPFVLSREHMLILITYIINC